MHSTQQWEQNGWLNSVCCVDQTDRWTVDRCPQRRALTLGMCEWCRWAFGSWHILLLWAPILGEPSEAPSASVLAPLLSRVLSVPYTLGGVSVLVRVSISIKRHRALSLITI